MKRATRVIVAGLFLFVSLGILPVSVGTQDRGRGPVSVTATNSRDVRDWARSIDRSERTGELRLRRTQTDTMLPRRVQHERLEQYYKGVPVFGGDVARAVENGLTLSVFGLLYSGIDLDPNPKLSEDDAAAVFQRRTGHSLAPRMKPQLAVLPRTDGSYVLVYRVSQYTRLAAPVLFVNAATGEVELEYDDLHRQAPAIGQGAGVLGDRKKVSAASMSGTFVASDEMRPPSLLTFDLRGDLARAEQMLEGWISPTWGDVAVDSDNDWSDPAVVDAHVYMGLTYDYYFKRFGRKGIDDKNGTIVNMIHAVRREDTPHVSVDVYNTYLVTAFWYNGWAFFGDGNRPGYYDRNSGQQFNFLSGALDAVAHELTHGLTEWTSNLIYRNESGALNEAFSDILATSAEFYYQAAGSGTLKADYLVGEDVVTPGAPGSPTGLRSLADPVAFHDPDHYSARYTGPLDNGGVHTNALIGGHAFYLAVEGGTNRTSGRAVQGVGGANREQIERVFYRAFAYYLPSNATYHTARTATIRAAQELYGSGSAPERAITQAWDAVGVY